MKALIMAAGMGSRISRHLSGKPKCCVKINDDELIQYTFSLLNRKGINDIAIVTGYGEQCILNALENFKFKKYTNYFFDVTNSLASAWFALEYLDENDDMIVMNADVFVEEQVVDVLLNESLSPVFLSDSSRITEADYKFNWSNNKLIKYGKELTPEETTGEYVGIARINKDDVLFMKNKLQTFINAQQHGLWWEDLFYRSLAEQDVFVKDINGLFWAEVDYIEDYERIQDYLSQQKLNAGN